MAGTHWQLTVDDQGNAVWTAARSAGAEGPDRARDLKLSASVDVSELATDPMACENPDQASFSDFVPLLGPGSDQEPSGTARVDLGHEDWEDKVECPASPKALFKEVPDTPPSNASWDVIPANKPAITKMAADEVPLPRGPLTVVSTTARKGPTKAYSMHLLDTDGVTVGCGWRPGPLKISELAEQDFHAEPEVYLGCTRCFRHFTFPSRKLSEGLIAQVPRALTRFPPCLKARRRRERAQVPRALIRPPPGAGSAGAEGPDTQPRRGLEGGDTGAEGLPQGASPVRPPRARWTARVWTAPSRPRAAECRRAAWSAAT